MRHPAIAPTLAMSSTNFNTPLKFLRPDWCYGFIAIGSPTNRPKSDVLRIGRSMPGDDISPLRLSN
jgi:hypothetical protein